MEAFLCAREERDGEEPGVLSVEQCIFAGQRRPAQMPALYCAFSWIPTSPTLIA